MRVFFISPWPITSALCKSTVIPHIIKLLSYVVIDELYFFAPATESDETDESVLSDEDLLFDDRFSLHALPGRPNLVSLKTRIFQHMRTLDVLSGAATQFRPDLVFCRGTAGIYGHHLRERAGIPYVVESFEPHAEYMRQTKTWAPFDPRYLVQSMWERNVKKSATAVITVSKGYAEHLRAKEQIEPVRLFSVPCWVDTSRFNIAPELRERIRKKLGIKNQTVAIYAGKFGGIYCPSSVLQSFRELQPAFAGGLYVIILSDHDPAIVHRELDRASVAPSDRFVGFVDHDEVNAYLNAADFALSFINAGPWSFACSAIKHGEYWAAGLPVLMPPGVGDESQWLEKRKAGFFVDFVNPRSVRRAGEHVAQLLRERGLRSRLHRLAEEERSAAPLAIAYRSILERVGGRCDG